MNGAERRRAALAAEITQLIDRCADGSSHETERDDLLARIARFQAERNPAYERWVQACGVSLERRQAGSEIDDWPALPTDVFRYARVATHPPTLDRFAFRTSGTTQSPRGVHFLRDDALYRRAAYVAGRAALFPEPGRMNLLLLAPTEQQARDSSLSYMLARFVEWFGRESLWVDMSRPTDHDTLRRTLEATRGPLAILGTSFAFARAIEILESQRFQLPPGSRLMVTGGDKGRTRQLDPEQLRSALARWLAIPESHIVGEYGMTELSSQMYEMTLRKALQQPGCLPRGSQEPKRLFQPPGWVRVTIVDAQSRRPVAEGETGLLRVDDAANLDSACCILTGDLGRRRADGFQLLGRASGAPLRGCSLTVEEAWR